MSLLNEIPGDALCREKTISIEERLEEE